jgi:hypothetical protein
MFFKFYINSYAEIFSIYYPKEKIWVVSTKRQGDSVAIIGPRVEQELVENQEDHCDHDHE